MSTELPGRILLSLALASAALSSPLAHAQAADEQGEYQAPDFLRSPIEIPPPLRATKVMRLSIRDAIVTAIKQNLGVALSRQSALGAQANLAANRGQFEPLFSGSYTRFDSLTPPATAQEGAAGQSLSFTSDTWNLGISQSFVSGTRVGLEFSNSRSRSNRGTAVEPLLYRSGLDVRVTQSLLRGFSFDLDIPAADILRAELSTEIATEDMRSQMMTAVQATENAYWTLVFTLKSYQVQEASLQLAEAQLEQTKKQIEAGLLAPASLIEAESALAQRRLDLVQAEASIGDATDALREVMGIPRGSWTAMILPTDAPSFEQVTMDEDAAMRQAAEHRPDLRSLKIGLERSELDLRVAANNRLPTVDFTATYGLVGQEAKYGSTLGEVFSNDSRAWSVGVNLSWTPLGRAARARITGAEISRETARSRLAQTHLAVYREVRQAVRELETAARQLRAAARFRDLSARALDVEQRKFVSGTSSNFLVTQRQNGLRQAQQSELEALVRHKRATTNLQRTLGTLLDEREIQLTGGR